MEIRAMGTADPSRMLSLPARRGRLGLLALGLSAVGPDSARAAEPLRWKFTPGEVVRYVMTQKTTNSSSPKTARG